jgi:hypothetical protein
LVIIVKERVATFTRKFLSVVSLCVLSFAFGGLVVAQQPPSPRGVPPPLPVTPDSERTGVRLGSKPNKRFDAKTPNGRNRLGDVRKDFAAIQVVNNELRVSVTAQAALDYKYISSAAGKIRMLANRLNSNLALGKPQVEGEPVDLEYNDARLRSSLFYLHRLVARFVDNPIFREPNVLDIPQTKRAKQDVDGIMSLTDQIRRITQQLSKD